MKHCIIPNKLQKAGGHIIMDVKKKKGEIKVNVHFNDKGEPLQGIIERNLKTLAAREVR